MHGEPSLVLRRPAEIKPEVNYSEDHVAVLMHDQKTSTILMLFMHRHQDDV